MTVKQFSSRFQIDGHFVGEGCPVYIIAEAGVAHFGNEEKAYQLVDLAAEAGADAVKFQVFDVDEMIAKESQEYGKNACYRVNYHTSHSNVYKPIVLRRK